MHFIRFAFKGFLALAALAAAASSVSAQQPAGKSDALVLTVRPSGFDAQNEARARQERLLRKLEQADYSVRSICTHCGDAWKHQTYAPFHPLQALSGQRIAEE